ncbi:hypothetical protein ACTMU2_38080 [Cupriavidus basilensis]
MRGHTCDGNTTGHGFCGIAATHPRRGGQSRHDLCDVHLNRGIEIWRFNVPTDASAGRRLCAHTLSSTARCCVSVKPCRRSNYPRRDCTGLALPAANCKLPDTCSILAVEGSGQDS